MGAIRLTHINQILCNYETLKCKDANTRHGLINLVKFLYIIVSAYLLSMCAVTTFLLHLEPKTKLAYRNDRYRSCRREIHSDCVLATPAALLLHLEGSSIVEHILGIFFHPEL